MEVEAAKDMLATAMLRAGGMLLVLRISWAGIRAGEVV
jgi:hypothetical protein